MLGLILSIVFAPAVFFLSLVIFLATIGKTFGVRRLYIKMLLIVFEWGKQRIELHERQRSDITSSTDTEVDDDDQSCDTEQANGDITPLIARKTRTGRTRRMSRSPEEMQHQGFSLDDMMDFLNDGIEPYNAYSAICRSFELQFDVEKFEQYLQVDQTILNPAKLYGETPAPDVIFWIPPSGFYFLPYESLHGGIQFAVSASVRSRRTNRIRTYGIEHVCLQLHAVPFLPYPHTAYMESQLQAIIEDEVTQRFDAAELSSWNLLTRTTTGHQFIRAILALFAIGSMIVGTAIVGTIPASYK
ncbi:hypothetical protein LSH36_198g04016 [Paralvinella palmiformis]|uniref:Uncharacterized protein n=1 Tax=Paralvinella palmiformis TaxID=53620 RepID=A0AAD9N4T8_9ANNE|nr:hypothetical protein LSH36_198g04016 [Paralvinella palmiformis]